MVIDCLVTLTKNELNEAICDYVYKVRDLELDPDDVKKVSYSESDDSVAVSFNQR
jgi:hypothetical protein